MISGWNPPFPIQRCGNGRDVDPPAFFSFPLTDTREQGAGSG